MRHCIVQSPAEQYGSNVILLSAYRRDRKGGTLQRLLARCCVSAGRPKLESDIVDRLTSFPWLYFF